MANDEAFVESPERSKKGSSRSLKLPLNEDGSIDWDSAPEKQTQAFIDAIKVDANGILANIQEEAGTEISESPSGIADATVVAAVNAVMVIEAIGITTIGQKFAPPLKALHPVVAIKACSVTKEEIQPIMEPAKRIIKRYVPEAYISAEWQDIAVVGEHLLKLSAVKFKECIRLAVEIDRVTRESAQINVNGRGSKVEIQ